MISNFVIAQVSETAAYKFGHAAGAVMIAVFCLAGIIKCVQIMRRPTAHKSCIAPLLLLFSAWLANDVLGFATKLLGVESLVLSAVSGIVTLAAIVAACVVAVVGLSTYDRTRFSQGKWQAIWALVLCSILFVAAIGYGMFKSAEKGKLQGLPATEVVNERLEFQKLNFSLVPPPGWLRLPKPEAISPDACVVLRRARPEILCAVIGEEIGGGFEREQFLEIVRQNLSAANSVKEQSIDRIEIGGRLFDHIVSSARPKKTVVDLAYEHWLAQENGFAWQILIWSKVAHKKEVEREARALIATFRVLDPDRIAGEALQNVEKPEFGYSAKLAGLGWQKADADPDQPLCDLRGARLLERLHIVPLRFQAEPPELLALARGLLSLYEFNYPLESEPMFPWKPAYGKESKSTATERTAREIPSSFSSVL